MRLTKHPSDRSAPETDLRRPAGRSAALLTTFRKRMRCFVQDRGGNVAILFCAAALPLTFGTGMGLDYVMASRRRAELKAFADGAALLTVSTPMMTQTASDAKAAATAFFNAQAQTLSGAPLASPVSITVTDLAGVNGTVRTTLVSFQAQSSTNFTGILGRSTLTIGGQATASSTMAPNVDFYLLLDTSPSMAIAATAAGISTMVSKTPSQGGCAFACHQTNPAADHLGNPDGIDNYQLARDLGVTLRMDLVVEAAQDLAAYAAKIGAQNAAHYRMGIWTFDYQLSQVQSLTSNLATVQQNAGNVSMLQSTRTAGALQASTITTKIRAGHRRSKRSMPICRLLGWERTMRATHHRKHFLS